MINWLWEVIQAAITLWEKSFNLDHFFVSLIPGPLKFPLPSYRLPSAQTVLTFPSAAFKANDFINKAEGWKPLEANTQRGPMCPGESVVPDSKGAIEVIAR